MSPLPALPGKSREHEGGMNFGQSWSLCSGYIFASLVAAAGGLCPSLCLCDEEVLTSKCTRSQLSIIPITFNPMVRRLHLSENSIRDINAALHLYGELRYLDLSFNNIESIADRSFENQKHLSILKMSRNKISRISLLSFVGLEELLHLDLSSNLIAEIPGGSFVHLGRLRELSLEANRIHSLDDDALNGARSLRLLNLGENRLRDVSPGSLRMLEELSVLDLSSNHFRCFGSIAAGVQGGGSVDACKDGLDGLRNLSSLRSLKLRSNGFLQLPIRSLIFLRKLERLAIGGNDFESIEPLSFEGLVGLRHLEISGCRKLSEIRSGAFSDNSLLSSVKISDNPNLRSIQPASLSALPRLERADLSSNQLATVPSSSLPMESLRHLDLSGNPLVCNCSILWLKSSLSSPNGSLTIEPVMCSFPAVLSGKDLQEVGTEELDCHSPVKMVFLLSLIAAVSLALLSLSCYLFRRYKKRFFAVFQEKVPETAKRSWEEPEYLDGEWDREYFTGWSIVDPQCSCSREDRLSPAPHGRPIFVSVI